MASSIACLVSTVFLSRSLLRPVRHVVATVSRSFGSSTGHQYNDNRGDHSHEVDCRSDPAVRSCDEFFSDAVDPFSPTPTLSQVLYLMDQFKDNPFLSASRSVGAGFCHGWDAKETDDALDLCIDMPGLEREDVKVFVVQNTLTIKGERSKEGNNDEESVRRYSSRIDLPDKIYKIDQIKAKMKNGMLRVVLPKFKKEERNDLFQVKIE